MILLLEIIIHFYILILHLEIFQLRPCYYYRYALEPETNENSLREGKRLEAEAESLKPHILESGQEISYTCLPTMVDGKGTIYILRQQMDCVNGSRKWPVLLTYSTVFMLT